MKAVVYSRWDGSQTEFSLDVDRALDALSDLLMEGLDVREALEWMRRSGFELAGMDFRVMGVDELLEELRQQALLQHPNWPLPSDRCEDFLAHERLAELMRRAG